MNTLLKAAGVAYPEFIWREEESNILGARRDRLEALGNSIRYMAPEQLTLYFNARFDFDYTACVLTLQIALEKMGWWFRYTNNQFMADHHSVLKGLWPLCAPTKPELLLKIVEVLP